MGVHPLVLHSAAVGVPKRLVTDAGETHLLTHSPPALSANDTVMVKLLVGAGCGIGFLPPFLAEPEQSRGELVRLFPEWSVSMGKLTLTWPASRQLAPRVRQFVDLAVEVLAGSEPSY